MATPKVGDPINAHGVSYTLTAMKPVPGGAVHVLGTEVVPSGGDRTPNRIELALADLVEREGHAGWHLVQRVVHDDSKNLIVPMASEDPRWARFPEGSDARAALAAQYAPKPTTEGSAV